MFRFKFNLAQEDDDDKKIEYFIKKFASDMQELIYRLWLVMKMDRDNREKREKKED